VAQSLTFAYPGDLDTLTGGYLYDKRIIQALIEQGWTVEPLSLGKGFPWPSASVAKLAIERLAKTPSGNLLIIDGLALGELGTHAQALSKKHPYIALVHHPLARESGLSRDQAQQLYNSETIALKQAIGVIVTSQTTAQTLIEDYGVNADQLFVIIPGIDRPALPAKPIETSSRSLRLLSVGAIVPRKGFDVLVRALHAVADRDWTLTIVGDPTRSLETTAALKSQIAALDLSERIELAGAVSGDNLADHFQTADAFVLASHYEGYGMAYAEALAWGLPIIGTTGGAVRQTVPPDAGILVTPGEVAPLVDALKQLIDDADTRSALIRAAQQHGQQLPTWQASGLAFGQALTQIASQQ